jgi:hypothetical protein
MDLCGFDNSIDNFQVDEYQEGFAYFQTFEHKESLLVDVIFQNFFDGKHGHTRLRRDWMVCGIQNHRWGIEDEAEHR